MCSFWKKNSYKWWHIHLNETTQYESKNVVSYFQKLRIMESPVWFLKIIVKTNEKQTKNRNKIPFSLPFSLQNAEPIRLGPDQFACPFCSKVSKYSGNIKRHILMHTGSKPYTCPHCPYSSFTKDNMTRHVKMIHTDANINEKLLH